MSAITLGQSLVLGVVEGLTEFLPVSSTAHLRIAESALGLTVDDPAVVAYTAVVQLGAVGAVLVYFAHDLVGVAGAALLPGPVGPAGRDGRAGPAWDRRLGWWIVVGTLPVVVVGLAAAPLITGPLASLAVVVVSLLAGSAWMVVAERRGRRDRGAGETRLADVVTMGVAQVAAVLLPGFSRSGATISAGLLRGLDRVAATRLSFLLSVPALVGAGVYELKDVLAPGLSPAPLIAGTAAAFVVALASIAGLLRLVARFSLGWFVGYRCLLALLLAVLVATGALSG